VIRVVVCDDNDLIRAGLVTVLASDPDIEVVGQASDGRQALVTARALEPDVVLMDIEMPGGDGITATRAIVDTVPGVRILVLTMFDLDDYVVEALRAGASGFLLKTSEPEGLIRSVHACAGGQATVDSSVLARVVRTALVGVQEVPRLRDLTARELDVLRSMAKGHSNAEVGAELHLAETTVKTHVARILSKLGVRDRLQAVVLAHQAGLHPPRG
jgi:DNA-binding NarL/FixJ family response regulator